MAMAKAIAMAVLVGTGVGVGTPVSLAWTKYCIWKHQSCMSKPELAPLDMHMGLFCQRRCVILAWNILIPSLHSLDPHACGRALPKRLHYRSK